MNLGIRLHAIDNGMAWDRFSYAYITAGHPIYRATRWTIKKTDFMLSKVNINGTSVIHLEGTDKEDSSLVFSMYEPHSKAVVFLRKGPASMMAHIAVFNDKDYQKILDWLQALFPKTQPETEDKVPLKFLTSQSTFYRDIEVPSWSTIRENYTKTTQAHLDELMKGRPEVPGRLMLWHGLPGTGKTFALRSLAWEWRKWCQFSYITDPDHFFTGNPSYMMRILMNDDDDGPPYVFKSEDREEGEETDESKIWRVLICEDTGDLLANDAKEQAGTHGLARLLNTVDGFIGQGLNLMVLITTNEILGKLHPAVTRPGRCASIIEFNPLTSDEVKEWGKRHSRIVQGGAKTIAELFSGINNRVEERAVGF